jgi:hypothetical protein
MRDIMQHPESNGEAGFTMVEVIVAMTMLVVGILAMLVMIEGSLSSTSRTTAREQATNLARDLVERAREVPYATTAPSVNLEAPIILSHAVAAPTALAAKLPENPVVSGPIFVVKRRNVDYSVAVAACSIDDPADGAGLADATFCAAPSTSTGPGSAPAGTGLASGLNVLGLPVTLVGSSLIDTVCNALATNTAIANLLGDTIGGLRGAEGRGAAISRCPSAGAGLVAYDATPDDLRRIRVSVTWTTAGSSSPRSVTQTTLLASPR